MQKTIILCVSICAGLIFMIIISPMSSRGQTFSNLSRITIPDEGVAMPYPSTINVAGVASATHVSVTLNGFTHTYPADVNLLLVGPNGANVALMFGAGSGFAATSASLIFSDTAPSFLSLTSPILSGTYRPTNFFPDNILQSPAPTRPYGNSLSPLLGTNPNGLWRLYIQDIFADERGSIDNGWTITFSGAPAVAPEPSSLAFLLCCGILPAALGGMRYLKMGSNVTLNPEVYRLPFVRMPSKQATLTATAHSKRTQVSRQLQEPRLHSSRTRLPIRLPTATS